MEPRQCGKATLARVLSSQEEGSLYLDLENPVDARRLSAPLIVLGAFSGMVVLEVVQRRPDLLPLLRVSVDRTGNAARFLLLGSASPGLVRGASEPLAGRIGFVDLGGFHLGEVGPSQAEILWLRGGFPRSFLAEDDGASFAWRQAFLRTFLERDIPQWGITVPAEALRRLWTMVAHFHGQIWNAAEFARALGTSEPTARRYLGILTGAHMVPVLPPWFENLAKRQVKSPKVYLRDSGLLHGLLELETLADVQSHPKVGASWEGFVVEQVLALLETRDAYFWATHGGAELDLLVRRGGKAYGFEAKYADAPALTRSMRVALEDLRLEHLWVVYPGPVEYPLEERVTVVPVGKLLKLAAGLRR